jgi:hypothetical protein
MHVEYACGCASKIMLTVRDEEQAKYRRKVEAELAVLVAFASMRVGDLVELYALYALYALSVECK